MSTLLKILRSKNLKKESDLLSAEENIKFDMFINSLSSSTSRRIIYRGQKNLFNINNVDNYGIEMLSTKVFMLGEKGKAFYKTKVKNDGNIDRVFEILNTKVSANDFKSTNTKNAISRFHSKNLEFMKFFRDINNKTIFANTIKKIEPKQQVKVIDYYLSFLHTIGMSGNSDGLFLSTSLKYKFAKKISDNSVIIIGWVPYTQLGKFTIMYHNINKNNEYLNGINLPIFDHSIYGKQ